MQSILERIAKEIMNAVIRFVENLQRNPVYLAGLLFFLIGMIVLFWHLRKSLRNYKKGIIEAVKQTFHFREDVYKTKNGEYKNYNILLIGIGGSGKTTTINMIIEAMSMLGIDGCKEITSREDRVMHGKTPSESVLVRTLQFEGRLGDKKINLNFLDPAGELMEPLCSNPKNRNLRIRKLLNKVDMTFWTVKLSKDLKKQRMLFERLVSQEANNPQSIKAHILETFLDKKSYDNPRSFLRERWASLLQTLDNHPQIIPINSALFQKYQKSPEVSAKEKIDDLNVDKIIELLRKELGLRRGDGL